MKLSVLFGVMSTIGACYQAASVEAPAPPKVTALGLLMKNEVNPTFKRLIVLAFHADTLEMDAETMKAELEHAAVVLQRAFARVAVWDEPPSQSPQGREVFYTYANSVYWRTLRLVAAIDGGDDDATAEQIEHIADTCNACHHFFRLRLRNSIVPSR